MPLVVSVTEGDEGMGRSRRQAQSAGPYLTRLSPGERDGRLCRGLCVLSPTSALHERYPLPAKREDLYGRTVGTLALELAKAGVRPNQDIQSLLRSPRTEHDRRLAEDAGSDPRASLDAPHVRHLQAGS
jgi:hypothetical protein